MSRNVWRGHGVKGHKFVRGAALGVTKSGSTSSVWRGTSIGGIEITVFIKVWQAHGVRGQEAASGVQRDTRTPGSLGHVASRNVQRIHRLWDTLALLLIFWGLVSGGA